MFEADFQALVGSFVGDRCWWNKTPPNYVIDEPIALLQQVGGKPFQYVEKDGGVPSHKHGRIMVTLLGKSYAEIAPLARVVENGIVTSPFVVEVIGAPIAMDADDDLNIEGTQQQFAVWFADP